MNIKKLIKSLNLESAGGLLLIAATLVALVLSNSGFSENYFKVLDLRLQISLGDHGLDKPLLLWINDGLMAFFFFLIGLELKRELLTGQLRNRDQILLPAVGAIGGLVVPAGIYAAINWGDDKAMQGWAIPAATDIAFAVGILALLGSRVPPSLKIFLVSLAIFDDIAAIVIIAIFYTSDLSIVSMVWAGGILAILGIMNKAKVKHTSIYWVMGIVLWFFLLKSGVHATLAGVMLAITIPLKAGGREPLHELEHGLHPWVNFVIVPIFALANAGIPFEGMSLASLSEAIPLGILAGLFIGKQIGAFSASWLMIKLGFAKLPERATWAQLYGVCVLTGIGFTMSLFISGLAFEHSGENTILTERVGILAGSFLSAVYGAAILLFIGDTNKKKQSNTDH